VGELLVVRGGALVHLVDRSDVIDKVVYTLANPFKDGLVDTVAQWPGVNGRLLDPEQRGQIFLDVDDDLRLAEFPLGVARPTLISARRPRARDLSESSPPSGHRDR